MARSVVLDEETFHVSIFSNLNVILLLHRGFSLILLVCFYVRRWLALNISKRSLCHFRRHADCVFSGINQANCINT